MSVFTEIGRAIVEDNNAPSDADEELITEAPEDDFTPPDPDEIDIGELLYEADMEEPVTPMDISEKTDNVPEVTVPKPVTVPKKSSDSRTKVSDLTGIIGDVQFTSGAIINAPITGNVKGTNIVINAPIKGDVTGNAVTLNSTVTGSLVCDSLILTANGRMEHGTMTTKSVAFQNE